MNIRFLGTGAANWPDSLHGTEEYRRFSSITIDDTLLIDPGKKIFEFAEDFGCHHLFDPIANVLLTHSHDDHLNIENLQKLCDHKKRILYCEEHAAAAIQNITNIEIHPISLYTPLNIAGYTVTAVPANHGTDNVQEQALHYIIEKDGKRIFYGCDGAWLRRDTWYYMREFQYDLMIFDGTLGDVCGDYRIFEHNNLRMVELMAETVRNTHVLKSDGKIIISHLACKLHGTQKETEKRLAPSQIGVAYDGMTVNI